MLIHFLLLVTLVSSCNLKAKVYSETNYPMWAQFTFHNETKSEIFEFNKVDQNYTVHITGLLCNLKPTILKVYKDRPTTPDAKPFGQTSAFIEGMGMLDYTIYYHAGPRMGMRAGVSCGFGDCGSRG
ncbi:unnamed protein product [Nippostrongylus brasiliensis]|uniref:Uncharacterized protein n=1 Tax=Nippostrongylus brasiliensis TaxID=27835 RepID=A0A0N4YRQ0_NIPBR|nr:hypothetical protein Q1695_005315 [Nippostrongylus brasiliensis]VDL83658.1 unnamed protein product [Nippostrongylus brasiliensis]